LNVNFFPMIVKNLRAVYTFPNVGKLNWYPGHMHSSLKQMAEKLKSIDVFLEIRDARIPLSSKNEQFEQQFLRDGKLHRRLIIFNKLDLVCSNVQQQTSVEKEYSDYFEVKQGIPIIFTNAINGKNIDKIIPRCVEQFRLMELRFQTVPKLFMIYGVPNVGKSSIINALRKKYKQHGERLAKMGPLPGVTRNMAGFLVCQHPKCMLMDTPGIMVPNISNPEIGLKLALIHSVADKVVDEMNLSDFLLFQLNQRKQFEYVKMFQLQSGPTDVIHEVLTGIAVHLNYKMPEGLLDLRKAANYFIGQYRKGNLGKFILDNIHQS